MLKATHRQHEVDKFICAFELDDAMLKPFSS